MIGQTVSHYKILEKLGEGGMGVVYKAEDTRLKRLAALKFLPKQFSLREDDQNICSIYEIGETDDGQLFIAMGYYEGQTLKDKIAYRPLPIAEAIDITIQIAEGLNKAHKKNIIG